MEIHEVPENQLTIFDAFEQDYQEEKLPKLLKVFSEAFPELEVAAVYIPDSHLNASPSFLVKCEEGYQNYDYYDWCHVIKRFAPIPEIPNHLWIRIN